MRKGSVYNILFIVILAAIQAYAQVSQPELEPLIHPPPSNVTPPPPSEGTPPSFKHYIDNFINNLDSGKLIYNPPITMTFNITESINATITKESNLTGESIKVAPIMEVYLKGLAFYIDPITEARQFVASTGPTIWKWNVIPQEIGNQTLDLLAYVIIEMPDGREEKRSLVKSKTIYVQVNLQEKQTPSKIMSSFLEGPWAKVLGALSGLIAFIAVFFKEDILEWIRSKKRRGGS